MTGGWRQVPGQDATGRWPRGSRVGRSDDATWWWVYTEHSPAQSRTTSQHNIHAETTWALCRQVDVYVYHTCYNVFTF